MAGDTSPDDEAHSLFPDVPEDFPEDADLNPDRLAACSYWRCEDLFEQRNHNHIFCRKACRSRHHKWARSVARKKAKQEAKAARAARN